MLVENFRLLVRLQRGRLCIGRLRIGLFEEFENESRQMIAIGNLLNGGAAGVDAFGKIFGNSYSRNNRNDEDPVVDLAGRVVATLPTGEIFEATEDRRMPNCRPSGEQLRRHRLRYERAESHRDYGTAAESSGLENSWA